MWFHYSLATAFFAGISDTLAKKALEKSRVQTIAVVRPAWCVLFILPFVPFATHPTITRHFWIPVLTGAPLEVVAVLIFHKALKSSPISFSIPYLAFTPVFLLILGRIFFGEVLTMQGVIGIFLVTAGAFVLQAPMLTSKGWDLRQLLPRETGPLLILLVAFLFSITSLLAKRSLQASSPIFFGGAYYSVVTILLIPFQWGSKTWAKEIVNRPKLFVLIGLMEALVLLLQSTAFLSGAVAYVIAVKRLSLLVSVFLGWMFLKETNILSRATGALLMAGGAILIGLA